MDTHLAEFLDNIQQFHVALKKVNEACYNAPQGLRRRD